MIKVKALAAKKAEILIYGPIGEDWYGDGTTAISVDKELKALGDVEEILVRINSPGGSVFDGIAIANMLRQHAAIIDVRVEGLAASAASVIAMAGDTISMGTGTQMMIHNPWTMAMGSSKDMRATADMLDSIRDGMVDLYAARTKQDPKKIVSIMNAETWYTADQAIENGFADVKLDFAPESAEPSSKASWASVMSSYRNTPDQFQFAAKQTVAAVPVAASANLVTSENSMSIEDINAAVKAALSAESSRQADIKALFKNNSALSSLMNECIADQSCDIVKAQSLMIEALTKQQNPEPSSAGPTLKGEFKDASDKFIEGAAQSILARSGNAEREASNEFNGMSVTDLAARALALKGISVAGLTRDGIARKVLASQTTSDFPQMLSNVAGKMLRAGYDVFPQTWKSWCAVGSVSDFKSHPRIQVGAFNSLDRIYEGGEYTYGSFGEAYETAQANTYGKGIMFTRQMMVNDDLNGLQRRARLMGEAVARTVNNTAYAYLTSGSSNHGPTSTDTGQFFNATAVSTTGGHANLTSAGTALSVTSLGVGRVAMQKQKDPQLKQVLNIQPSVLLVPVAKEDTARVLISSETDPASSNSRVPNIYRNRFEVVSDPYLDDISATAWYLLAGPNSAAAAFEMVFLDGVQTPYMDDTVDFETDAMKFKARLDFGVAIGDWRGGYKNVGA